MTKKRAKPDVRKEEILEAAIPLAVAHGYRQVTRNMIAEALGVAPTTVQYHFGTMGKLRTDIIRRAVKGRHLKVVAQAIVAGHPAIAKIDGELKAAAVATL